MKSVLVRLREYYNQASNTEKSLIDFILQHPRDTTEMTVYKLAEVTFSSPSSIIRMCKKNGFEGYKDFTKALIYELALREHSQSVEKKEITRADSIQDIVEKVTYKNIVTLEDTKTLIDNEMIEQCIELIRQARNICLFGMGSSLLVAQDAHLKFMRLNKPCTINVDWHVQLLTAKNMSTSDIAIIISYSGETVEMIQCAKAVKETGAKIISITGYGSSPIVALADYPLYVAANEAIVRSGAMSSRISQLNMIDILYTGYANTQFEKSLEKISKTHIQKREYPIE